MERCRMYYSYWRDALVMDLEVSLFELCRKFIGILNELKEQSLISEEEYKVHSKQKNKFIQTYIDKNKLQ